MKSTTSAGDFTYSQGPPILQDEGVTQGAVRFFNFTGAGVTCARVGATGTCTIPGGGAGSANVVSVELNFGAAPGNTDASTVVTGQAWVTSTSIIVCSPTMFSTADRSDGAEDAAIEGLTCTPHTRVASTGFTLTGHITSGTTTGRYLCHCTGA